MYLLTYTNSLLVLSCILLGASATPQLDFIPQPDLIARQQPPSTFSSKIFSKCYTSRLSIRPQFGQTVTQLTRLVSASSTTTIRKTTTITPKPITTTVTSTARVTSTVTDLTNTNLNTVKTVTSTTTRVMTTTSVSTQTIGVRKTAPIPTTTASTSPGFVPVRSSLPTTSPVANSNPNPISNSTTPGKRNTPNLPIPVPLPLALARRQRPTYNTNRPYGSYGGPNRQPSYAGNILCLTVIASGPLSSTTTAITTTLPPKTTTTTKTITSSLITTTNAIPPRANRAARIISTTTSITTTTSTLTFRATRTTTTTTSIPAPSTSTVYAACTARPQVNVLSRLYNRPVTEVKYDGYATFKVGGTTAYDCCVATLLNPDGAMWVFSASAKEGCLVLVNDGVNGTMGTASGMGMCAGGQKSGNGTAIVRLGAVRGADDFTVGNGYCGGWNQVALSG